MVVPCVQYRNEKATHTAEYKYYGIKIQLNHIHEPDLDTDPPKRGKTHMSLLCGITEKRHFTRNKKYVNMNILNIRAMYRKILFALLFAGFACLSLSAQKPLVKPPKPTQSSNAGSGKANSASLPSKQPAKSNTAVTTQKQQAQQLVEPAQSAPSTPEPQDILTATGSINGHDYVDLGLSVRWATCNVGATSPSGYGNYYAWGEISPKSEFTTIEESVKYVTNLSDIAGDSRYDAARANWGGSWRLPTKAEIEELESKCKREWTTQDGHKGYLFIGPNGKSIFLPAAGNRINLDSYSDIGKYGKYWSSTPYINNTAYAYCLDFSYVGTCYSLWTLRCDARTVRPVSE